MSEYVWLISFALGTALVLLVAHFYLRSFFKRIAICIIPLAVAAWVTAEAIDRQRAETVTVVAGKVAETPGARLDKSIDFRAEIADAEGKERQLVSGISVSNVESLAQRWYEGQIERLKQKDKTKTPPLPETLYEVKGEGASTGSWFWEKHEKVHLSFKIPEGLEGQASGLINTITTGLNRPRGFRFNMGVDLAGGTILIYEAQESKDLSEQEATELAVALKKRIDPANLREITIRPIRSRPPRVEIILPMQSAAGTAAMADIAEIKDLISRVGSLGFRILADRRDDSDAIDEAKNLLPAEGLVPNLDRIPAPDRFAWVEFGDEAYERMQETAKGTKLTPGFNNLSDQFPIYYAPDVPDPLDPSKRKDRFFVLTIVPTEKFDSVRGEDLGNIRPDINQRGQWVVNFQVNAPGDEYLSNLTTPKVGRLLAVVMDERVTSYATIQEALRSAVQVTMGTGDASVIQKRVQALTRVLKSGALPATLKREPVSELTMGPGLGADTIRSGARAVTISFILVVAFMCVYYRFSGFVASAALFANLLFTVGFMVFVKAPFTLPGLAGLVLMLGMAVDSNVLIYERLRDERERGSNIALAIRNAYQLSFPVIIDTHLTTIFTGVVLYMVGNDQLKGFAVSMVVGLFISLFTSLYMTRLLFDMFLKFGWLKELRMSSLSSIMRWFGWPNIDFMRVRFYCFVGSVVLSVISLGALLLRGERGLDIDFTGGTAYSVEFKKPQAIEVVRGAVAQSPLPDPAVDAIYRAGGYREDAANQGGTHPGYASGGQLTPNFTFRTTMKDREAVRKIVADTFGDQLIWSEVQAGPIKKTEGAALDHSVELTFANRAVSREEVGTVVEKWLAGQGVRQPSQFYDVQMPGEAADGREAATRVTLKFATPEGIDAQNLVNSLAAHGGPLYQPKSERLENFDSQLAREIQNKALLAITLSWAAICMFLWFRFGSWTYGLAAVLCLVHDVLVTVGFVALAGALSGTFIGDLLMFNQFKLDLPAVAALLTLVGYTVNDKIVNFERIREVRGKSPELTTKMLNDSLNQTLSRTLLTGITVLLVLLTLYITGGEGIHLFSFIILLGTIIGTYSSVYVAAPLLLIFGEGKPAQARVQAQPQEVGA